MSTFLDEFSFELGRRIYWLFYRSLVINFFLVLLEDRSFVELLKMAGRYLKMEQ